MLAAIVAAALVLPFFMTYGVAEATGAGPWEAPSRAHWLGTDSIGRDLFVRVLYGTRLTIGIAFLVACLSGLIGAGLAFYAAVRPGAVDWAISRGYDVLLSIPHLILALMVVTVVGSSVTALVVTMAVIESAFFFRVIYPVARDVMTQDYVEAARLRKEGAGWIVLRELVPNVLPTLITEAGLRVSFAALFLSALSYLGLGVQPPYSDLGALVRENVEAIAFGIPTPIYPAVVLALFSIAVNGIVGLLAEHHALRAEVGG